MLLQSFSASWVAGISFSSIGKKVSLPYVGETVRLFEVLEFVVNDQPEDPFLPSSTLLYGYPSADWLDTCWMASKAKSTSKTKT